MIKKKYNKDNTSHIHRNPVVAIKPEKKGQTSGKKVFKYSL